VEKAGIEPGQIDRLIYVRAHRICRQNSDFFALCGFDEVRSALNTYNLEQEEKAQRVYSEAAYDWAAVHLYWNPYGDVIMDPYRISVIREATGGGVPLIATECGGPAVPTGGALAPEDHFVAAVERNLTGLAEGLEFLMWSFLAEGKGVSFARRFVPLLDSDFEPKAGYWAYKLLALALDGVTRVDRVGRGWNDLLGTNLFVVTEESGGRKVVAWNAVPGVTETIHIKGLADPYTVRVTRVVDAATGEYTIGLETAPNGFFTLSDLPVVIDPTP
jgi:hypothetical protein